MPDGIEFDFLALGNADAILVTAWFGGAPTRTLVDGGRSSDVDAVNDFLTRLGVYRLDHIVCTHPHQDHAAGVEALLLSGGIGVGTVWMHNLEVVVDWDFIGAVNALGLHSQTVRELREFRARYDRIAAAARQIGAQVLHPFPGQVVGGLVVCGPSHRLLLDMYGKANNLKGLAEFDSSRSSFNRYEALLELLGDEAGTDDLGGEATDPINETSVVLGTVVDGLTCVLTGDAGVLGLTDAATNYALANVHLLQVPHHGSRRNMTESLVEHLSPTACAVSAEGSVKHPSRKLVNTLKRIGAVVYSTHYPRSAHLRFAYGVVPTRVGYGPASPLYHASD